MTNARQPASASNRAEPPGPRLVTDAPISPSFAAEGSTAYELKFLVDAAAAARVAAWAGANLRPDVHADPALAGSYEVSSLYLDTPRFDVFHGAPDLDGAKLRLRRYGNGNLVFLERKRRRGDRVEKQRTAVEAGDLARLELATSGADWPGSWFQEQVQARAFQPVCRLTYLRAAFFHPSDAGHLRLTLDRAIRCVLAKDWSVGRVAESGASPLADGLVVCELKFQEAMPQVFKQLVAATGLIPGRFSKYRRACIALGLVNEEVRDDA